MASEGAGVGSGQATRRTSAAQEHRGGAGARRRQRRGSTTEAAAAAREHVDGSGAGEQRQWPWRTAAVCCVLQYFYHLFIKWAPMQVLAPHRLQLASQAAAVGAMLQNSHSSLSITLETHCGGPYSDGTCERG